MDKVWVGGVGVRPLTCSEWVDLFFEEKSKRSLSPKFYTSANGNLVSQYHRSFCLKTIIDNADGVDADGMSLVVASRLFSKRSIPERVVTTDFFHRLISDERSKIGLRIFFLGGTEIENIKAVSYVRNLYSYIEVSGRDGYFKEAELDLVVEQINAYKPDILFVGMGVPLEHHFVNKTKNKFRGVTWIKTCGGMFKVLGGEVKRPPEWMGKFGLEWLYRCVNEPRHVLVRYMKTNPHAIWLFIRHMDR